MKKNQKSYIGMDNGQLPFVRGICKFADDHAGAGFGDFITTIVNDVLIKYGVPPIDIQEKKHCKKKSRNLESE